MQNKTIDISFSALSAFTQCNRRFDLRYNRNLTNRIQRPSLSRGSVGHLVLETWNWDIYKGFEIIDTEYDKLLADMQDAGTPEEIVSETYTARDMLKCAIFDYYNHYKPWDEVISQEERKVVQHEHKGYTFNFNFKIDKIIKNKDTGKVWIVDHKFSKFAPKVELLNLSFQSATYYILGTALKADFNVHEFGGVIFDCIKDPAKNIELTAKGQLAKVRNPDKLLIQRSCTALDIPITSPAVISTYNYDMLPDTTNLQRIKIKFTPHEIDYYMEQLAQVLDRIIYSYEAKSFPVTWNNFSCNGCEFSRLCYNQKVGNDVEGIISRDFIENKLLESDVVED